MYRLAAIFLVCTVGCGEPSSPSTVSSVEDQKRDVLVATGGHPREETRLAGTTIGDIELNPTTVLNGKLSLLIPGQFSVMDDEALRIKYPNERRPTLAYTNESGSVNVAINHTKDRLPKTKIEAFHKQMDGMFRNLYPSATWFESGVIEINGCNWLTLNLRTPAVDTEIRNIMVGTSVEGRLLLVSFNVTKELEDEWLEPAEAIVNSLSIKIE